MVSYKYILRLSLPIMVGSAVQNLITLTDTIFLGRVGRVELGAIGLVGVFYLLISAIGYSFTKAGQIMIARRMGAESENEVGQITHAMALFSLMLATILFFLMRFGGRPFFSLFVKDPEIFEACISYLDYRCYGVFFSYLGVCVVALYTGVARTTVIIYNALALGVANTLLNYGLIFGKMGLPEMGIAGAALASTCAEVLAFSVFIIYILLDKKIYQYKLFSVPKFDWKLMYSQIKLSTPIVLQSVASIGSWFIFFALIEQLGKNALAVSNIIRAAYMLFMIPAWGFSSGINTIVSNLMGKKQMRGVMDAIKKTAIICFVITVTLASSIVLFPNYILRIGTDDPVLIKESLNLVWILMLILSLYSVSIIYFNGLVGTGATRHALIIQVSCVLIYTAYVYVVIVVLKASLPIAWFAEVVFWIATFVISYLYLRSGRWTKVKI